MRTGETGAEAESAERGQVLERTGVASTSCGAEPAESGASSAEASMAAARVGATFAAESAATVTSAEFGAISAKAGPKPFLLRPAGKDYIWGGRRLRDDFCKDLDLQPLAESWECSTHPDGESRISGGSHDGETLRSVMMLHPEYLGTHAMQLMRQLEAAKEARSEEAKLGESSTWGTSYCNLQAGKHLQSGDGAWEGGLPILVKLIDAADKLSVQVHPSDEYARIHENGSLGKTEMWYVIDADPGAKLVYGFESDMTEQMVRSALSDGSIEKYLQFVPVHPGDVFFIEAGTVHAIGAGILIAEVQESSNLTYRLYDYNRPGKDGKPRPLHIDKALACMNYHHSSEPRQPLRVLRYKPGFASEFLTRCKYFQVERILLNTERVKQMAEYRTGSTTFEVLLCINGCGTIYEADGTSIPFFKGDSIFVPAESIGMKLHGKAEMLKIGC